ncbi:MAG: DUF87 domain-containing protein [Candidatus Bipolaricaulota bacterium]
MGTLNLGPNIELALDEVIGQCVAILGIRGSGKSNTAGVIYEELLAARYPLSIIDTDGEYFGLKEKYEVLVVGEGENVDIELDAESAAGVAEVSLREGIPVVVDVSGMLSEDRELFVLEYLSRLWSLAGKLRKPYMIGIEECHEFIPQGVRTELKEMVARMALRGRKRGLGAVVISQRSAKVEKDVLTQAGMLFLHRVVHEADMRVYGELLPWRKGEVKGEVAALGVGECIFLADQTVRKVQIRLRDTFHGGFTPAFQPVETPKLRQVRGEILAAIEQARAQVEPSPVVARARGEEETGGARLALRGAHARPHANPAPSSPSQGESPDDCVPEQTEEVPPRWVSHAEPAEVDNALPEVVLQQAERLIRRLSRRPLHERRMLSFLASREPRAYTTGELAAWIDCAEAVLLAEPPAELVELGLVCRERFARGITYRIRLRPYVSEAFSPFRSELGSDGLHRLVNHLRGELQELD